MTVDVWERTLKCTVIGASHDETCSHGGNGNCSYVLYVDTVYTATCYCMWHTCSYKYYGGMVVPPCVGLKQGVRQANLF